MKLFVCYFLIIPVLALHEVTPKLCVNCKFFMNSFLSGNQYGKCSFFPTTKPEIDLVTGIKTEAKHQFCSIAREYENMCGKEGKKYVYKLDT
jgi:hypothetical protein